MFDGLRCGEETVGNDVVGLDAGGGDFLMRLHDWVGFSPGIVAVADVTNAERLQCAENLRELGVVSRVSVTEMGDDSDTGDE